MLSLIGAVVFSGTFGGVLWANARRWRYLSKVYARATQRPIDKRNFQSAVLLGLGGFNSLKGILTIGIHETGVSLRVLTPFSLFHAPLFIPFSEIEGWKTSWYLNAPSTELEFHRAPEVRIVMPAEQAEWIQSFADHKMTLHDTRPVNGNAGRGWHAFMLINTCISVVMLVWVSLYFLAGKVL